MVTSNKFFLLLFIEWLRVQFELLGFSFVLFVSWTNLDLFPPLVLSRFAHTSWVALLSKRFFRVFRVTSTLQTVIRRAFVCACACLCVRDLLAQVSSVQATNPASFTPLTFCYDNKYGKFWFLYITTMEYLKNITRFGLNFTFLANVLGSSSTHSRKPRPGCTVSGVHSWLPTLSSVYCTWL